MLRLIFFYDPVYVTDRFPNHTILSQDLETGVTRIQFKANDGYGLKMWLLMQGHQLKIIKPLHLKQSLIEELNQVLTYYQEENQIDEQK